MNDRLKSRMDQLCRNVVIDVSDTVFPRDTERQRHAVWDAAEYLCLKPLMLWVELVLLLILCVFATRHRGIDCGFGHKSAIVLVYHSLNVNETRVFRELAFYSMW